MTDAGGANVPVSPTTTAYAPEPAIEKPMFVLAVCIASAIHPPSLHFTNVAVCEPIDPHNDMFIAPGSIGSFANSTQNACAGLHPIGNNAGKDCAFNGVNVAAVACENAPAANPISTPPAIRVPPESVNVDKF